MPYDLIALRDGCTIAFRKVYRMHFAFVYRCCLAYCRQPEIAEEAAVDVFVRLFKIRGRINPDLPLEPLLQKIAKDTIFSSLKKIATTRELKQRYLNEFKGPESETTPEVAITKAELQGQLRSIVDRLPPRCRKIFSLHHFHGTDNQQIAKQLMISPHTVKAQLVKARRILRYELRNW